MVLLLASVAFAALVGTPPLGATEVTVLACAGDACADRIFWATNEPTLRDVPVVLVDTILAERIAEVTQGEAAVRGWREGLDAARLALIDHKWAAAESALDEAEKVLPQARPSNQDLFTFTFLRGAVEYGRTEDTSGLAHAAAIAWNRTVTLPEGLEALTPVYYDTLRELLQERPGQLVLERTQGDPDYELDGVKIGHAPIAVDLFPGVHRLRALDDVHKLEWVKDVRLVSGRTTRTRARFANGDDPVWAAEQLIAAIDTHQIDEELGDVLSEWAERHKLRRVRIIRLESVVPPAGTTSRFTEYTVEDIFYEPRLRRFSTP